MCFPTHCLQMESRLALLHVKIHSKAQGYQEKPPHVSLSFLSKQNGKTVHFPFTPVATVSFPGLPDCYMPETKRAPRGLDLPFPGCVRRGRLHMRVSEQELTRNQPGSDNSNWEPQLSAL